MPNPKKAPKDRPIHTQSVSLEQFEAEKSARLRLAADYANLERRVEEERGQLFQTASAAVLERLFPVFDNFYRSSSHAPKFSEQLPTPEQWQMVVNYLNGVGMIERQLEEKLAELGLKKIVTAGQHFNPNLHEAISYEPNSQLPADTVIAEVESGWTLGERVLRPAKVRVSQGS